jgi:[CysO sulfur-carrier protein]-S-L-cysteine hydrolase
MPALQLKHEQLRLMIDYAQAELPNEACGLLAGLDAGVMQVLPIANIAAKPQQMFEMDASALLPALKQIDAAGWTLLGIYHSHPRSDPIPSQKDIASVKLNYPHIAHVIISFKHAKPRLQAWHIDHAEIYPLEVIIGEESAAARENNLTQAQQYAILLAALLAFVVMLSLSFALLPPAPMITPIAP